MSKGKVITEESKDIIRRFYESDEVSRMCPRQNDCIKVISADLGSTKVQKRWVLGNLREIYEVFKNDEKNPKVGFSTFAKLWPP